MYCGVSYMAGWVCCSSEWPTSSFGFPIRSISQTTASTPRFRLQTPSLNQTDSLSIGQGPEEEPGDEEMTFTQGNDWYRIRIDAAGILFDVAAPGGTPWKYHIPWADITRVCYTTTNGPQW